MASQPEGAHKQLVINATPNPNPNPHLNPNPNPNPNFNPNPNPELNPQRNPSFNPNLGTHDADSIAEKAAASESKVPKVSHQASPPGIDATPQSIEPGGETSLGRRPGVEVGAWSAVRLGGADFYDPTLGLQMDGFGQDESFLSSWEVALPACKVFETEPGRATPSLFQVLRAMQSLTESVKGLTAVESLEGRPMAEEQAALALDPSVVSEEPRAKGGDDDISIDDVAASDRRAGRRRSGARGKAGARLGEETKGRAAAMKEGAREVPSGEGKQQPIILARRPNRVQPLEGRGTLHVRVPAGAGGKAEQHAQEDFSAEEAQSREEAFPPLPQRQLAERGPGGGKGSKGGGQGRGSARWEKREDGAQAQAGQGELGRHKAGGEPHADEENNKVREVDEFPPLPSTPRPGIIRLPPGHKRIGMGMESSTVPRAGASADVAAPETGNEGDRLTRSHGQVSSEEGPVSPEVSSAEEGPKTEEDEDSGSPKKGGPPPVEMELVRLYVGFEHECPHGHRCLFSPRPAADSFQNQLNQPTGSDTRAAFSSSSAPSLEPVRCSQLGLRRTGRRSPRSSGGPNPPSRTREGASRRSHGMPAGAPAAENVTGVPMEMLALSGVSKDGPEDGALGRPYLGRLYLQSQGEGAAILSRELPLFRRCTRCEQEKREEGEKTGDGRLPAGQSYGGHVAQLQRIYIVTPSHPVAFSSIPSVEFAAKQAQNPAIGEASKGQPTGVPPTAVEQPAGTLQFRPAAEVVLPPSSTVCLRLPFVYPYLDATGQLQPIVCSPDDPEAAAVLKPWTAVRLSLHQGAWEAPSSEQTSAGS